VSIAIITPIVSNALDKQDHLKNSQES